MLRERPARGSGRARLERQVLGRGGRGAGPGLPLPGHRRALPRPHVALRAARYRSGGRGDARRPSCPSWSSPPTRPGSLRRVSDRRSRRDRRAARARGGPPRQHGVAPGRVSRGALLETQRQLAATGDIIVAGRDIGTVVLPDAELKLYLEVSIEERARRRAAERDLATGFARGRGHPGRPAPAGPRRQQPRRGAAARPGRCRSSSARTAGTSRTRWPRWSAIIRASGRAAGADEPMSEPQGLAPYPRSHRGPRPVRPAGHRPGPRGGPPDLPTRGPLIIAANHMSNADPPFVGGWLGPALERRPDLPGQGGALRRARWASSSVRSGQSRSRPAAATSAPTVPPRPSSTAAASWPSCPKARAASTASWVSPSRASRCWPRARARRSCRWASRARTGSWVAAPTCRPSARRITLRVGRPFSSAIPEGRGPAGRPGRC